MPEESGYQPAICLSSFSFQKKKGFHKNKSANSARVAIDTLVCLFSDQCPYKKHGCFCLHAMFLGSVSRLLLNDHMILAVPSGETTSTNESILALFFTF